MTTPVINCIKSHKIFVLYMQHCMECAGLYPLTDSFDLLQPDYIQSLGLDHSFVRGFASSLQSHVLNTMYMGYCSESGEVACDPEALRSVVCKVHCKILQNSFLNLKKMVMFVWLFCFFFLYFSCVIICLCISANDYVANASTASFALPTNTSFVTSHFPPGLLVFLYYLFCSCWVRETIRQCQRFYLLNAFCRLLRF